MKMNKISASGMRVTISVRKDTCIKCDKCVRVCPAIIFAREKKEEYIRVEHVEECIGCGHCVSVCPTASVQHNEFQAEKVHAIDYTNYPSPAQLMELIKARRSNRAIISKPVPTEMLDMIVEAAHCAPTATNSQNVSFTLVTNPAKLRWVAQYTIGVFRKVLNLLENPILKPLLTPFLKSIYRYVPTFKELIENDALGKDPILRKATALLLIHSPGSSRFGCEDANLAYQNASLMAESLGVSQIYMGFVLSAIKQDRNKDAFAKELNIEGKIHAIMALGMPAFRYPNYTDRKTATINKIG